MTVIVSVKINDGVVMASDSATTFANHQTYLTADKIVNLVKGIPVGVMVTGSGNIGSESITTMLKDLRRRLDGSEHHDWSIDRETYTVKLLAERVAEFLQKEKVPASPGAEVAMKLRLCGYSGARPLPEVWEVIINSKVADPKIGMIHGEDSFGVNWDGEYEPLDRLVLGVGTSFLTAANKVGILVDETKKNQLIGDELYEPMALPAMPIQDAIDLARYMVETTAGFVRFSIRMQPKTVGGSVEIAAITKHEGFKWVQRKHFYPTALNPSVSGT